MATKQQTEGKPTQEGRRARPPRVSPCSTPMAPLPSLKSPVDDKTPHARGPRAAFLCCHVQEETGLLAPEDTSPSPAWLPPHLPLRSKYLRVPFLGNGQAGGSAGEGRSGAQVDAPWAAPAPGQPARPCQWAAVGPLPRASGQEGLRSAPGKHSDDGASVSVRGDQGDPRGLRHDDAQADWCSNSLGLVAMPLLSAGR